MGPLGARPAASGWQQLVLVAWLPVLLPRLPVLLRLLWLPLLPALVRLLVVPMLPVLLGLLWLPLLPVLLRLLLVLVLTGTYSRKMNREPPSFSVPM